MSPQHVFVATGPLVAVFREALDVLNAHIGACIDGAKAFHPDAMPFGRGGGFTGRSYIEGIVGPKEVEDWRRRYKLDPVPDAWRWVESRSCYRPRQGKPGKAAADYLAAHKDAPRDPSFALAEAAGLPLDVMVGNRIFWPQAAFIGDDLWVFYGTRLDAIDGRGRRGRPDLDNLSPDLREARLSEFHAAVEAIGAGVA